VNARPSHLAEPSDTSIGPTVTVVVPARNEEAFIGSCLDSILAQDYGDLEVLVIDGDSTDGTTTIVEAYAERDPRVRLLRNGRRLIPISLNLALAEARGTWLIRVDAHATVPPDYVGRAVAHLETGRWGGVGGRKDGIGRVPAGRAVAAAMASRFGVGGSTYHHGTTPRPVDHVPFGAYPVELARRLGGWDEELAVNQDFEFDCRVRQAGNELLFDPELAIEWHCRQSVGALFQQYRRYGRGKVAVAAKHPGSVRPRHLAAPALVASLALALVAGRRRPAALAAVVVPYSGAVAAATVATARTIDDPEARRWVAPAFVAMHVGWGVGFWTGVARLVVRRRR
jgi:succinoglycan biosynthesis protein ExoA